MRTKRTYILLIILLAVCWGGGDIYCCRAINGDEELAIASNEKVEITLYNAEREYITDAEIMVDSFPGKYSGNARAYLFDCDKYKLKTCRIRITHKDYIDTSFVYDFSYFGTHGITFYMRRQGESYYLSGGQRIPCFTDSGKLLVRIIDNTNNEMLDSARAIALVIPLFDSLNLVVSPAIIKDMPDHMAEKYSHASVDSSLSWKETYAYYRYDYLYTLRKADGSEFNTQRCEILGKLRSDRRIVSAGPIICSDKNCFFPSSLSNKAVLYYDYGASVEQESEKLSSESVEILEVNVNKRYVRISMDKALGQRGLVVLLEELLRQNKRLRAIYQE